MMDLVAYTDAIPQAGETLAAKEFAMACGGKGANQAIAAARLGADVVMVGRVGDDAFADDTLNNFRSCGIDPRYVERVRGVSSGVAQIWVDADSQNRILILPGANLELRPHDLQAIKETLQRCSLIVLQLEIPLATVYAAIEFGSQLRIPVLLNPAPANPSLALETAARCDYFIPNETELQLLTGRSVDSLSAVKAAAAVLMAQGLKNQIVTLGAGGALWLRGGQTTHFPAPRVDAVDTTGAGDAFIGCLAGALAEGATLETAIPRAVNYASLSVTRKGTQQAYLGREAFEAYLQRQATEGDHE